MPVGVVLDAVPAARDLSHDLGVRARFLADAEKARLCLVLVEQREHARRQLGVRAVVEGETHLPPASASGVEPAQVRPEEPAAHENTPAARTT